MRTFLPRRILLSLVTLLGSSLAVFVLLRVVPGDPARLLLPEGAPEEAVRELGEQLGLRKPLYVQYVIFMNNLVHGSFGESFQYKAPAFAVVMERLPNTILLTLVVLSLVVAVAVPAGILAAVRRGTPWDYAAILGATLGQALPNFWLGIMLILLFAVSLHWLPSSGMAGPRSFILPAITLAAFPISLLARLMRSNLVEALGADYIRTAWSKGLAGQAVIVRHALKNAAIPVVTVLGLQFGVLLSGAVITEQIFDWPGIGKLIVQAIFTRDYPVIQAALIVSAFMFIAINLCVDVAYAFLDPRIRYE